MHFLYLKSEEYYIILVGGNTAEVVKDCMVKVKSLLSVFEMWNKNKQTKKQNTKP